MGFLAENLCSLWIENERWNQLEVKWKCPLKWLYFFRLNIIYSPWRCFLNVYNYYRIWNSFHAITFSSILRWIVTVLFCSLIILIIIYKIILDKFKLKWLCCSVREVEERELAEIEISGSGCLVTLRLEKGVRGLFRISVKTIFNPF